MRDLSLVSVLHGHPVSIHLVGIGGIGMAGLAELLLSNGHRVSGSDLADNRQVRELLLRGARISQGHAAAQLPRDAALLVRSSAVGDDNAEVREARRRGVPVHRRGEVFAAFLQKRRLVAVCGTHGKTTTSAMLAHLLAETGAGWFVGGESPQLGAVARDAVLGRPFVAECDESDGTLVHYHPELTLVTNVEFDHMETFDDEAAFLACFERVLEQSANVIRGSEDEVARRLAPDAGEAGLVGVRTLRTTGEGSTFDLAGVGQVDLPVPGRHNVMNATLAAAAALHLGLDAETIRRRLATFQSVGRRFETVRDRDGIRIVSDYAHHPTEIRAVLEAALALRPERVLAVYQPHRYTRTLALRDAFPPAFAGIDKLWLLPVYAASEAPIDGGTSEDLARCFAEQDVACSLMKNIEEAWRVASAELRSGDLFLILGAGDVVKMCDRI